MLLLFSYARVVEILAYIYFLFLTSWPNFCIYAEFFMLMNVYKLFFYAKIVEEFIMIRLSADYQAPR